MATLEEQFEKDLYDGYELLKHERGYVATDFLQMLRAHGGVGTARRLLQTTEFQAGLVRVWQEGMLAYSLENAVLQRKYRSLFTETERSIAKKRLKDLKFEPVEW